MRASLLALLLGFCLDLLLGDPPMPLHPVRLIGDLIVFAEKRLRRCFPRTKKGELAAGTVLVVFVSTAAVTAVFLLLFVAGRIHPAVRFVLETLLCYQLLAARALRDESRKVYEHLREGDLEGSRRAVSRIVGRDTQNLTEEGVIRAAVETVAENTSDGVLAPMLFLALGGAGLGIFYKAVSTMDSMVGYRNETYRYFGRAAARLDDALNYLPSRISALLMTVCAGLCGLSVRGAFAAWRRDRRRTDSPNAGQTEAVAAGALGIQLGGDAWYFGRRCAKPTIGDALRPPECEDICRADRLMYVSALVLLLLLSVGKAAVIWFLGR